MNPTQQEQVTTGPTSNWQMKHDYPTGMESWGKPAPTFSQLKTSNPFKGKESITRSGPVVRSTTVK